MYRYQLLFKRCHHSEYLVQWNSAIESFVCMFVFVLLCKDPVVKTPPAPTKKKKKGKTKLQDPLLQFVAFSSMQDSCDYFWWKACLWVLSICIWYFKGKKKKKRNRKKKTSREWIDWFKMHSMAFISYHKYISIDIFAYWSSSHT